MDEPNTLDELDPGPQVGPTHAELASALCAAGDPNHPDFHSRVLAEIPRHYTTAQVEAALAGLGPPGELNGAGGTWPCEAYGPEGVAHGVLCFFSPELGQRACGTLDECRGRLAPERERVVGRIAELAESGGGAVTASLPWPCGEVAR